MNLEGIIPHYVPFFAVTSNDASFGFEFGSGPNTAIGVSAVCQTSQTHVHTFGSESYVFGQYGPL